MSTWLTTIKGRHSSECMLSSADRRVGSSVKALLSLDSMRENGPDMIYSCSCVCNTWLILKYSCPALHRAGGCAGKEAAAVSNSAAYCDPTAAFPYRQWGPPGAGGPGAGWPAAAPAGLAADTGAGAGEERVSEVCWVSTLPYCPFCCALKLPNWAMQVSDRSMHDVGIFGLLV